MKAPAKKLEGTETRLQCDTSRRNFFKTVGAATMGGLTMAVAPGCEENGDCDLADSGVNEACNSYADFTGDPADESYWQQVRTQFVLPSDLIYLNTGTEGSMPCFVLDSITRDLADFAAQPTDTIVYDERCSMFLNEVKQKAAAFIGADLGETVLTTNTTEGLGWVANGLEFSPGDEIITTVHFEPYNSCLKFLRDRKGLTLTEIDLPTPATDKQAIIDAFENAITANTKMFCFCHINYATGLRMPVKEICEVAAANGIITLVDAAHAIGQIDIDVKDLGVDFYATSPHKWLCAPPGTGVLYMRQEMQNLVWPVVTEAYPTKPGYSISSTFFSARGQQATPLYAAVADAIDFQSFIGKDNIEARNLAMGSYAKQKVIEKWGQESLFSPVEASLSTAMVSFNPFPDNSAQYLSNLFSALWERNIITRSIRVKLATTDSEITGIIRICPHLYNNYDQLDFVFEEIEAILPTL